MEYSCHCSVNSKMVLEILFDAFLVTTSIVYQSVLLSVMCNSSDSFIYLFEWIIPHTPELFTAQMPTALLLDKMGLSPRETYTIRQLLADLSMYGSQHKVDLSSPRPQL